MTDTLKTKDEKYVRPTVGGWLRPLMMGPWLSVWIAVSAYAAFGPEWRFVGRWVVWGVGMLAGSLLAFTYVLMLAAIDLILLAVRVRQLPTGRRAWLGNLVSPVIFLGSYLVLRPWAYYKGGPWTVLAMLLVPMVVTAIGSRFIYGVKIRK